jgi:hypothetical protein
MAERWIPRLLTILALNLGLASCAGATADGKPFREREDTAAPGTGGSSPVPETGAAGSTSESSSQPPSGCCRICLEGKPCGDSCVSRDLICHEGAGCACDG